MSSVRRDIVEVGGGRHELEGEVRVGKWKLESWKGYVRGEGAVRGGRGRLESWEGEAVELGGGKGRL